MKNRNEIPDYNKMAKALKNAGWDTWYHEDNWVQIKWLEAGKNISRMGKTTEEAYESITSKNFEYRDFLFTILFYNEIVQDSEYNLKNKSHDELYTIIKKHRNKFMQSEHNVKDKSHYDCIISYFSCELQI